MMAEETKDYSEVPGSVTGMTETVAKEEAAGKAQQDVDQLDDKTVNAKGREDDAKVMETDNDHVEANGESEASGGRGDNQEISENGQSVEDSDDQLVGERQMHEGKQSELKTEEEGSPETEHGGGDDHIRATDGEDGDVEDNAEEDEEAKPGNAAEKTEEVKEKKERVLTGKSVQSSINVKIVRIKDLDDDAKSEAKSFCSRRSEHSTFVTALPDEVSVAPTFDEVQAELDRVLSRQTAEDGLPIGELPGRTATRNTPATPMTDYNAESPTKISVVVRHSTIRAGTKLTLASLPSATKDTIYQRALALMDTRCSSHTRSLGESGTTDRLPLLPPSSLPDHPYRHFPESFFYVTQQRPLPAAPVKAWRGYHGNVYFEPLTCRQIDTAPVGKDKSFYTSLVLKNRGARSVTFSPKKEILSRHNYKRATTKRPGTRQMALLDKTSVIQRMDENVQEDVRWINGMESVGSLRVGGLGTSSPRTHPERTYDKMKIRRGFVSHSSSSPRFQTLPMVEPLTGGRMSQPVSKSQYLTTQYRGNSRQGLVGSRTMAMSISPELYNYSPSAPLPSLEKIQASLQNVEKSREMVFSIPPYHPGLPTADSTPRSPKTERRVYSQPVESDSSKKLQSY